MSYELYTMAGSCSMAVHAIMNELGLQPKIHIAEKNDGPNGIKSPAYLKINPRGNVPCLIDDGKAMIEGGHHHVFMRQAWRSSARERICPCAGFAMADVLQCDLHPAYGCTFWINANLPEEQREAALNPRGRRSRICGIMWKGNWKNQAGRICAALS